VTLPSAEPFCNGISTKHFALTKEPGIAALQAIYKASINSGFERSRVHEINQVSASLLPEHRCERRCDILVMCGILPFKWVIDRAPRRAPIQNTVTAKKRMSAKDGAT
jgi:hypothetical protein